jgi:hypothetical protein
MKFWSIKNEPEFHLQSSPKNLRRDLGYFKSFFKFLGFLVKLPFVLGFLVGGAVVFVFTWPLNGGRRLFQLLKQDYAKTKQQWVIRKFRLFSKHQARSLATVCLCAVLLLSVVGVNRLVGEGLLIKGRVLGQATLAVDNLKSGGEKIAEKNPEGAAGQFSEALDSLEKAQFELSSANVWIRLAVRLLPAGQDGTKLLEAGDSFSQVGKLSAKVLEKLNGVKFSENGLELKSGFSPADMEMMLQELSAKISAGLASLESVDAGSLPSEYREKFQEAKSLAVEVESVLPAVRNVFIVAKDFLGEEKHIVVFLQNSNELRATGGFVGTYGSLETRKGYITSRIISSIYDLDGQQKEVHLPPLPVLAVNDRWFLRDANWFFNFPDSAKVMSEFYQQTTGKTPDLVVAVTPEVVVRLLGLVGPVEMEKYNVTLDAENFIERTQVETSVEYDRGENKPKKMIADFFPIFLKRLSSLDNSGQGKVLQIVLDSFSSKAIQIFAKDEGTETALESLGWAGSLSPASRDYLAIVSSNLGGTKTDLSLLQNAKLESQVGQDGQIVNKLTLTRSNPLPDMVGLQNKSFVRIFVPKGSKLLNSSGFDAVNLDVKYDLPGKPHPAVALWEADAVKSVSSGMQVGLESGKTYFGSWVVLKGGESKTVTLEYELPFRLQDPDRVSLVVDKQAGAKAFTLDYTLAFQGRKAEAFGNSEGLEGRKLARQIIVDRARYVGLVLRKEP